MKCRAHTRDGSRCDAHAQPNGYCCFHDPDNEELGREKRRQGGIARMEKLSPKVLPEDTPDIDLTNSKDVVRLLSETINQVRTGRIAVNVGNALGILAGVLLKAMEADELEARVASLEHRAGHNHIRRTG